MNKEDLKIGMYVRTKHGIGRVDETEMFMDKYFQFHLDSNKGSIHNVTTNTYWNKIEDIIGKPSYGIGPLLKSGDFLNNHCISEIKGPTVYTMDGWFIDFDDIEDLVDAICTKEQFENISYRIGENNGGNG